MTTLSHRLRIVKFLHLFHRNDLCELSQLSPAYASQLKTFEQVKCICSLLTVTKKSRFSAQKWSLPEYSLLLGPARGEDNALSLCDSLHELL